MRFLNGFSAAGLLGWLVDFYLLATLVMLIAIVVRSWIRQPAKRLTVNWVVALELAALAVVCALPFWPRFSLVGAVRQRPGLESAAAADHDSAQTPADLPPTAFPRMPRPVSAFNVSSNPDVPESAAAPVTPPPRWSLIELAAAAYVTSAGLVVLWLFWGAVAAARACWRANDAPQLLREELMRIVGAGRRVPRLLVSSQVTTAVALGLRRPAILLPAGLVRGGSPPTLRAILTHEWAHIRNGDLWLLALGRGLLVLLFPHPLFWWLRRAIRGDQELLADAAAAGDNRPAYAEELLRLARNTAYASPFAGSGAVGIWESSSQLSRRIAVLLDESFRVEPTAPRRWRYRALGLLAILGAACSLLTLQPARSAGQVARESRAVRAIDSDRPGNDTKSEWTATGRGLIENELEMAPNAAAPAVAADSIVLPVYRFHLLADAAVRKELKLDAHQIGKLKQISDIRAIQAKFEADDAKVRKTMDDAKTKNMPQDELAKLARKLSTERSQRLTANLNVIRDKAMEVLTPAQAQSLKELTIQELAYSHLIDPTMGFTMPSFAKSAFLNLNLTKEQNEAVHLLGKEASDWFHQYHQTIADKTLSILTPQQKAGLRAEALGPLGPNDPLDLLTVNLKGESKPLAVYSLAPYPDFTQASVRKELGLSAAQERRVQDILGGSTSLADKFARDLEKLSPDELKRLRASYADATSAAWSSYIDTGRQSPEELAKNMIDQRKASRAGFGEQPVMKPSLELRRQFEAVLTPPQLDLYRDSAVKNFAAHADEGTLLPMIGASKEQQAEVERLSRDLGSRGPALFRELGRRLLTILSPSQQHTMRAEFEKEIATFSGETMNVGDNSGPPPEGKALVPAKVEPLGVSYTVGPAASMEVTPPAPAKTESFVVSATVSPAASTESKPPALITTGSAVLTYVVQPAANTLVISAGTAVLPSVGTPDYSLLLPVYTEVVMPDQQRRLGISAEQLKKLRKISADWWKKNNALSKEPPQTTESIQLKFNNLQNDARKQVREVLTSQQWQAFLTWKLDQAGTAMMFFTNVGKQAFGVDISPDQQHKIDAVRIDRLHQKSEEDERFTAAILAVLSATQREQLRPEIAQRFLVQDEAVWSSALQIGPVMLPNGSGFIPWASGAKDKNMVQEERDLQYKPLADYLGLSADQQNRFWAIDAQHRKRTEEFVEELKKRLPDERRKPEIREKAARMRDEIRLKILALLTPQQWETLKEYEYQNMSVTILTEIATPQVTSSPVRSTGVQEKIALDEEQMASMRRIVQEHNTRTERSSDEAGRKAFEVLTAEQQNKIRDYIENRQ